MPADWVREEPSPDGTVRARVQTPEYPSIAECNPAARPWRDLLVDPDLAGLVPGRARPSAVTFEYADGRTPWTLPLDAVLPGRLAWHPHRPLAAGLAVHDRRAYVWVADHEGRTVTRHLALRAAVSFTGYGAPPVAWCGDGRLALLIPPGPPEDEGPPDTAPVVFEAEGPGHVVFDEPVADLERLAGARVAIADLDGAAAESPEPLTPPLLIRSLMSETPDGRTLRLGIGHSTEQDALQWTDALLDIGAPSSLRPVPANAPPDDPVASPGPAQATGRRARHEPTRGARTLLLWIRAFPPGQPTPCPAPTGLEGDGHAIITLDLPLDWPPDATPETLRPQILDPVENAVKQWDGPVVVGGHSFAATLALYALAHIPALTSAIAYSGCYNRSLTPTGFHYEKRAYWDAQDVYDAFSALRFADRIDRPVLLVHGAEDRNPATPPEQTVELYRAVVAAGGRARLVLLPHEGHEFRYRETHGVLAREHRAWLGRF